MKKYLAALLCSLSLNLVARVIPPDSPVTRVVNGKTYIVHTVVRGETLYKISARYKCTVGELQKLNKNTATLKVGSELLIPMGAATVVPVQPAPEVKETPEPATPAATRLHTIVRGETLSKIARNYGTTVAEIKKLNGLPNENIKVGQVLKVPAPKGTETPVKAPEPVKPADPVEPAKPETGNTTKPVTPDVKAPANGNVNPGMPEKPQPVPAPVERITEKEETGEARLVDTKMDQSRNFVMHPSLPKGSIVVVINPENGRMAYCRVVDNYATQDYHGAGLLMTRAIASKIGMENGKGEVKIKYAAP
ncbi:MAG: LysM peptidoglycan-binding domain-containing protein [Bacteroidetes bacterium]|nr:LysM peptidoglycan-binding domain-containing protein [Bacteroidota bacterium]